MPAIVTNAEQSAEKISYTQFNAMRTSEYDGVVFTNDEDVTLVGVYLAGSAPHPRLMLIESDGGTIVYAEGDHHFPIRRSAATVTFKNV